MIEPNYRACRYMVVAWSWATNGQQDKCSLKTDDPERMPDCQDCDQFEREPGADDERMDVD